VHILVCSSPTSNLGGKQFLSCGDSTGWFLTCFNCNFCALLSKSAVACQFCIIDGGVPDSLSRKEKPQITGFMKKLILWEGCRIYMLFNGSINLLAPTITLVFSLKWHLFFFFFFYSTKPHSLESIFCESR